MTQTFRRPADVASEIERLEELEAQIREGLARYMAMPGHDVGVVLERRVMLERVQAKIAELRRKAA